MIKKIFCLVLALALTLSFAGCTADPKLNSATDIQVYYWKAGYGYKFMEKIAADYNASQDKYNVEVTPESNAATIIKTLDLGKNNTFDLYFTMLNTSMYNKDFLALDDVLDSKAPGEDVTIRSKYYDYLLNGVQNADKTTNFLTYGMGWVGIIYNSKLVNSKDVPNTTDELDILTAELAGIPSGAAPWIFYNDMYNNGYWNYVLSAWEAQYDGLDYYYDTMMTLKDAAGNSPSKDVFVAKDGRYEALKVLEKILTPATVHPEATSTNFTKVQSLYLSGEAAMTVNGSWLMNESTGTDKNFVMMKMPVISSIVKKLEDTAMTDETLSEIISLVDSGATSSELCSANDFKKIKEARNFMFNNSCEQYVFIPKLSPAQEGAKDFLRYFYSDKGTLSFMSENKIPSSVRLTDESKFDRSTLDSWFEQQFKFADTLTAVTDVKVKSEVYTNASINQFAALTYAQSLFASNPKDRKNTEELWRLMSAKINENWEDWTAK